MNSNELQKIIKEKIEGQGTMIDLGNALPVVLRALSDRMSGTVDVTVKIHSKKKNATEDDWEDDIEGVSGTLIVKGFDVFGNALPVQEIPFVGEAGAGTIDINLPAHQGDTIAVLAKIAGKGASCQLVTKVVKETTLEPEVYPAGLYEMGDGALSLNPGEEMYKGTVIVTEDFAILWPAYQREGAADETVQFGPLGQVIPSVLITEDEAEAFKDFDGALNTAAILSVFAGDCAARVASKPTPSALYNATGFFLPSMGILKYLYDHKAEINAFITAENEAYGPETDYQLIPKWSVWSSTLYDGAAQVWYVNLSNGNAFKFFRDSGFGVVAVSAFQTLY